MRSVASARQTGYLRNHQRSRSCQTARWFCAGPDNTVSIIAGFLSRQTIPFQPVLVKVTSDQKGPKLPKINFWCAPTSAAERQLHAHSQSSCATDTCPGTRGLLCQGSKPVRREDIGPCRATYISSEDGSTSPKYFYLSDITVSYGSLLP